MKFRYTKVTTDLYGRKNTWRYWKMKLGLFDIKLLLIRKRAEWSRSLEHKWNMWRLGY